MIFPYLSFFLFFKLEILFDNISNVTIKLSVGNILSFSFKKKQYIPILKTNLKNRELEKKTHLF